MEMSVLATMCEAPSVQRCGIHYLTDIYMILTPQRLHLSDVSPCGTGMQRNDAWCQKHAHLAWIDLSERIHRITCTAVHAQCVMLYTRTTLLLRVTKRPGKVFEVANIDSPFYTFKSSCSLTGPVKAH